MEAGLMTEFFITRSRIVPGPSLRDLVVV